MAIIELFYNSKHVSNGLLDPIEFEARYRERLGSVYNIGGIQSPVEGKVDRLHFIYEENGGNKSKSCFLFPLFITAVPRAH